ncbi:MAG: leucine-rich repeat domain-containing protein [Pirellulaceae bacterium]|nr:leucine-rich repeat domain-containing protein [Pirellulaceae bacterium]
MARDEAYRKAEQEIEAALRSGAKALDLSGMGLTELPEWLGQLTQLQSLDLSENRLTALPEWLGQLTQLKSLDLSNNQLTALPESLGQLTQLQLLDLGGNHLTALPESLGQLTQLQTLRLFANQLAKLPEALGQLIRLNSLDLCNNELTKLPRSLGQLRSLQQLDVSINQLDSLPESLRHLGHLRSIAFSSNRLEFFPEVILNLRSLEEIFAIQNTITQVPDAIENLQSLRVLALGGKRISYKYSYENSYGNAVQSLPMTLLQLTQLSDLNLDDNPLDPELAAAYKQGLDAVKAYLRERAKGTRQRYEAKLLILGDGNEGKTCVSRALRGLPFEKQTTTRGVDVEPWTFPHPDQPDVANCNITLNLWDFEGQEINHQTHQFFLSTDSLYLLVFKCRDLFLLDRAEYWLDTIRSRAPGAQVAIVITECERRTPYVPQDRLLADYKDLLTGDRWLFAVGCEDNLGIPALQQELHRRAADLAFMGRDWPETYDNAETRIDAEAKTTSHVTRGDLRQIFADSGIDAAGYEEAARALARLGIITQFPDCPDLTDFIVLQPQWLTKAISYVMEDRQLDADQGEIMFVRMQTIWGGHDQDAMFPIFHNCMKEFELCYDLEDHNDRCLVPLRFGYLKPETPWTAGAPFKTRRVTYRLNLRPPMGLMSRFIVKTHHMIVRREADEESSNGHRGVYWHNGVFLQSGEGPLLSQALCEFEPESRTLSIEVRAAFPQKMLDQIDAYVSAVFAFFQGLKPVRSYGCIRVDDDSQAETQCPRFHDEEDILFALECRERVRCAKGRHHVDPMRLVMGIGSFPSDIGAIIREEHERTRASVRDEGVSIRERFEATPEWAEPLIRNIETLLDWADGHQQTLQQLQDEHASLAPEIRQELELKLREYIGHVSDMLDERHQKSAPSVFSIGTQDGSPWNPQTYFRQTYVLTPWCECEGGMHRHDAGQVLFPTNREWWDKTAPWIARGTKLLATGLQLAFTGVPLALGDDVFGVIKNDVTFMKELTKQLELKADPDSGDGKRLLRPNGPRAVEHIKDVRGKDKETSLMRAALTRFLEELAPDNYRAGQWGELKRTRLPDNSYRWLCEACARSVRK